MTDREHSWKPVGGVERPMPAELPAPRGLRTVDTGTRNGMPEWRPYVRSPKIAAREAEVDGQLAAIRARIALDTTSVCGKCGAVYWTDGAHKCGL